MSVNVPKTCEYLQAPPQPLALRMSSSLMMGVTRVWARQFNHYSTDVNHLQQDLKHALFFNQVETAKLNLDIRDTAGRQRKGGKKLTLEDDPAFDINAYGLSARLSRELDMMDFDITQDRLDISKLVGLTPPGRRLQLQATVPPGDTNEILLDDDDELLGEAARQELHFEFNEEGQMVELPALSPRESLLQPQPLELAMPSTPRFPKRATVSAQQREEIPEVGNHRGIRNVTDLAGTFRCPRPF
ncbi:R8 protein [Savitreella phatthalungensis]